MRIRGYSIEQVEWLIAHAPSMTREELTNSFNKTFSEYRTVEAIRSLGKRYRWPYKRARHWAEGLSKEEFKSHFSDDAMKRRTAHFNSMNESSRCSYGDIIVRHNVPYIVISDERNTHLENRIKRHDRYVWGQANGVLPDDMMLVHIDGDEFNNDLANLYPLHKSQLSLYGRWLLSEEGKRNEVLKKTALVYCEHERVRKNDRKNKKNTNRHDASVCG